MPVHWLLFSEVSCFDNRERVIFFPIIQKRKNMEGAVCGHLSLTAEFRNHVGLVVGYLLEIC
jgi:hypothetical protein